MSNLLTKQQVLPGLGQGKGAKAEEKAFAKSKENFKSKDFNNNNWDANKDVGYNDRSNTVPVVLRPRDKYNEEDPTNVNIGCSAVNRENRANFLVFLNFNHKHIFAGYDP